MKSLTKEKRDQLILTALVTIAALVGLWYGVITTQQKAIRQIAQRINDQETKVATANKLINSSSELHTRLGTASQKLRGIEQGMASGDMYSWIFLTMNKFRANRNVDIPQFSREVATDAGILPRFPYRAVMFNVRGQAFYHDLGKFLADFENTFPFMRVQNLELDPAGASAANARAGSVPDNRSGADTEKLAFKMEIVALVNPNSN